jgi:hypothetical protein
MPDLRPPQSPPQDVLDWIQETECDVMRLEPADFYDRFIVGVAYRFNIGPVLAYDMPGILRAHVADGMTPDEAEEHFSFNTLGSWVGEGTPVFLNAAPDREYADTATVLRFER